MNTLREALLEYVRVRRGLGYDLTGVESRLRGFVSFAEGENASWITNDLALRWAQLPAGAQPVTWSQRLDMVRGFAAWLHASDPRTEVPPRGQLSRRYHRRPPYIYSDDEVEQIVEAAALLPPSGGLRARTYSALFGLLAVSGMRIREALALDREDLDLDRGLLTIRWGKLRKQRLLPLHSSTIEALRDYGTSRDSLAPDSASQAAFLSERGTRVSGGAARYNFALVSREVGLRPPLADGERHGRGPRVHDLRHRFAVKTLVRWYREGVDVDRELPKLSTYLGHASMLDTYWYIEAVPELLALATSRLERQFEGGSR